MTELNTEIEIAATADQVWAAITAFEEYPSWNPFVRSISGELVSGQTLNVTVSPGGREMKLTPKVVAVEPGRGFAWKGSLWIGGLFDGRHEFRIEPLGNGSVRFVHREEFTGILVPLIWALIKEDTKKGFESMNAALKAFIEGQES